MFWGNKSVIAVAGGKGGIGKSCFVTNLGIVLAETGRQVVLVDADLGAANLHTLIGVPYPERTLDDFLQNRVPDVKSTLVDTPFANLKLLSSASDVLSIVSPDFKERQKIFRGIQKLETDTIIFDISAGTHQRAIDFFSLAPIGVIVVEPIPTSLENAFSFLKNLMFRYLLRLFYHDLEMKIFIGQMVDPHNESSKMVLFNDLISQLEEKSPERIKLFREEFSPERYKLCVIANAVRNVAQASVTEKFVKIVKRYLSLSIMELGSLPYEPMMDAAICQRVPFIVKYPESLYAANMRKIARLIPLSGNGKQP